jgi:DNA-binding transcriptional LysR family regulator
MDKLRALKYFLEVAEAKSFSQAAERLDVPVSSVSRRVYDLESELGITLLHRSTRTVKLTELGMLYLEQVRPVLNALNMADDIVGQHSSTPSGVLRITAIPDYGRFRLMPALAKLRQQYPEIICDVELTDEIANLSQNEVDIAIRATAQVPERSVARKLADGQFIMVASPGYLERHGRPCTLADLQQHKAILYRRPHGLLNWQAKVTGDWRELRLPPAFICNQGDALLDAVTAGQGIALLPQWGIRQHLAEGSLIPLSLDDADVAISRSENSGIYLLYHRPKYGLQKMKVAVDFLLAELNEDHAEDPV